jgi:hypothetical protein
MKKSSRDLLKRLAATNKKPYVQWIRDELTEHDVRVHRWGEFNWEETYYAYFDSRRVFIPAPQCKYSMLIALHEVGHIVKGERLYAYLAEYQAEKWAISTGAKKYGIVSKKYESSARDYVYQHLLEDVVFRQLPLTKIKKNVLKWIGVTTRKIRKDALRLCAKIREEISTDLDLGVEAALSGPRHKKATKE